MSISNNPIPCIFMYFRTVPEWTKAFAFLSTHDDKGRAFISYSQNVNDIVYYCYGIKEEQPSCCWMPDSPVLRELYELGELP